MSRFAQAPARVTRCRSAAFGLLAAAARPLDPRELLVALAGALVEALPHDEMFVLLLSEDGTTLHVGASLDDSGPLAACNVFRLEQCASSKALRENRIILRPDLQEEPIFLTDHHMLAAGLRSHLVAPLLVESERLGTLHVAHRQPNFYSEHDAEYLSEIAPHVARALHYAREAQDWKLQSERLRAMARGLFSIGPRPVSETMAGVLEVTADATGVPEASMFRHDEGSKTFILEAVTTPIPGLLERARPAVIFRLGEEQGLVGLVGATRQPLYVPDCYAEPRWKAARPEIRSAYMVPVVFGEHLYGVIRLLSERPDGISPEQRSVADTVAAYGGAVLENARLYEKQGHELELRRRQLATVSEAANQMVLGEDAGGGLQGLVDAARGLTAARYSTLAVWSHQGDLERLIVSGLTPAQQQRIEPSLEELGLLRLIKDERQRIRRNDGSLDVGRHEPAPDHAPINGFVSVPVGYDRYAGAFCLAGKDGEAEFSAADEQLLTLFAALAKVFLENLALYGEMARERSTLASIQSSMTEGLIVVDASGRVSYLNEAAATLSGWALQDCLGKSIQEVTRLKAGDFESAKDSEALLDALSRAAKGPAMVEVTLLRPQRRQLVATAFPIPTPPAERMTGLLLRDVTEDREMKRRRDAFVSVAAHELKTPMTTIVGFAELLLHGDVPEATRRQWLEYMRLDTHRLATIVDDLLNVSHIQAGRLPVKIEHLDLRGVVENALTLIRPTMSAHELRINIGADIPRVTTDPEKLGQVMMNLVDNAIKYSPHGGPITISATHEPARKRCVVAVADQGIGIAPEDQAHLFTTFYRVRRPETERTRGTGLGLYIVKELLELIHGEVWVESEPDKGSTFFFSLPVGDPQKTKRTSHAGRGLT